MKKSTILNVFIVFVAYLAPLYYLYTNQEAKNILEVQKFVFIVMFVGSLFLSYINYVNMKELRMSKPAALVFEIIGLAGVLYSGTVLYLVFVFRHGIGF